MKFIEALREALDSISGPKLIIDKGNGVYEVEQLPHNVAVIIDNTGFPMAMNTAAQPLVNEGLREIIKNVKSGPKVKPIERKVFVPKPKKVNIKRRRFGGND